MKNILSDRINKLSESATLAMAGLCRELKSQGQSVVDLSLGEPDFNTPDIVKDAAKTAIDNNFTFYTPVSGYLDLRKAICSKLKRDNNLDYTPEQIVVSNGAKQSIANAVLSLVNPGDEVLLPAPFWVSYSEIIKLAEGVPVYINAKIDADFKVTPEQVEAAITPKTKVFLFSSPCNPTGSVYSKEELRKLAEIFAKHKNIYIIADEIYEYINFKDGHQSIGQFDFIKENVITINGVSKGFAMTGWRIGYLAAPTFIAKACDKLQGQITSAPSSIAQKAALMAMNADLAIVKKMVKIFKERRDLVFSLLKEIPGLKTNTPEGAFYVYPEISYYIGKSDGKTKINTDNDFCMYLLKSVQVATVPGSAFGAPNYIRISYATSNDLLVEAIHRMKKALAELK